MRLKWVELRGFKGYNELTRTEFHSRINCIVGLNGSGKSTIVDAISLILSEASSTGKRHAEAKSILHKGPKYQAVVGHVELCFENLDRKLPTVRSDEVCFKRIFSLSSKSQDVYYLDGKKCTKGQFTSLLMAAGFSRNNPYYIIRQGRIVEMATMSEESRLRLVKNLSGIGVYEEKRNEALTELSNLKLKMRELNFELIDKKLGNLLEQRESLKRKEKMNKDLDCLQLLVKMYRMFKKTNFSTRAQGERRGYGGEGGGGTREGSTIAPPPGDIQSTMQNGVQITSDFGQPSKRGQREGDMTTVEGDMTTGENDMTTGEDDMTTGEMKGGGYIFDSDLVCIPAEKLQSKLDGLEESRRVLSDQLEEGVDVENELDDLRIVLAGKTVEADRIRVDPGQLQLKKKRLLEKGLRKETLVKQMEKQRRLSERLSKVLEPQRAELTKQLREVEAQEFSVRTALDRCEIKRDQYKRLTGSKERENDIRDNIIPSHEEHIRQWSARQKSLQGERSELMKLVHQSHSSSNDLHQSAMKCKEELHQLKLDLTQLSHTDNFSGSNTYDLVEKQYEKIYKLYRPGVQKAYGVLVRNARCTAGEFLRQCYDNTTKWLYHPDSYEMRPAIPDLLGPLWMLIEPTHKQFQVALCAALNNQLDTLIVKNDSVASQLSRVLKHSGINTNLTLTPYEQMKERYQNQPISFDRRLVGGISPSGEIEKLTDFGDYDAIPLLSCMLPPGTQEGLEGADTGQQASVSMELDCLYKQVASRYLIVKDAATGRKLANSYDCVTLDGILISRKGTVTGGYRSNVVNVMEFGSRIRQHCFEIIQSQKNDDRKRVLQKEIARAQSALDEISVKQKESDTIEAKKKKQQNRLDLIEEELKDLAANISQSEITIKSFQELLVEMKSGDGSMASEQELSEQLARVEQLERESKELYSQKLRIQDELADVNSSIASLRASVAGASSIGGASSVTASGKAVDLAEDLRQAEDAYQDALREYATEETAVKALECTKERLTKEIQELREQIVSIENAHDTAVKKRQGISREYDLVLLQAENIQSELKKTLESAQNLMQEKRSLLSNPDIRKNFEELERTIETTFPAPGRVHPPQSELQGNARERKQGNQRRSNKDSKAKQSVTKQLPAKRLRNDMSPDNSEDVSADENDRQVSRRPEGDAEEQHQAAVHKWLVIEQRRIEKEIDSMGQLNDQAVSDLELYITDYKETSERKQALVDSMQKLEKLIDTLNRRRLDILTTCFHKVNQNLGEIFKAIVPAGFAELHLVTAAPGTDPSELLMLEDGDSPQHEERSGQPYHSSETFNAGRAGVDGQSVESPDQVVGLQIKASFQPAVEPLPLVSLSGGQKTIVALCLVMALQRYEPAPLYILDEADAALDQTFRKNVAEMLKASGSQYIITTFRPELAEIADKHFLVTNHDRVAYINECTAAAALEVIKSEKEEGL